MEPTSVPMVRRRQPPRKLDLTGGEGTVTVLRTAYGQERTATEHVRVPVFSTEPARVRVSGSVTRNLGDYNSARVEVTVELPCYPEDSEIRRTYEYASQLLDDLIPKELEKAAGTTPTGEAT
jgi:hypothetical protein